MKLKDITLDMLLQNNNIKSVDFENQWYFSISDMNKIYPGVFNSTRSVPLPLKVKNGRQMTNCISFEEIINSKDTV